MYSIDTFALNWLLVCWVLYIVFFSFFPSFVYVTSDYYYCACVTIIDFISQHSITLWCIYVMHLCLHWCSVSYSVIGSSLCLYSKTIDWLKMFVYVIWDVGRFSVLYNAHYRLLGHVDRVCARARAYSKNENDHLPSVLVIGSARALLERSQKWPQNFTWTLCLTLIKVTKNQESEKL